MFRLRSRVLDQLPSVAEWEEFAELANAVGDGIVQADGQFTWEEVFALLKEICQHPVTIFLCRVCDVIRGGPDDPEGD